jgi:hypothetical protein
MLESVQRRATKLVKQFKGLDYNTRLENLNREEKPLQDEARRLGRIRMTDLTYSRTGLSVKYICEESQVCAITLTTCLGQAFTPRPALPLNQIT